MARDPLGLDQAGADRAVPWLVGAMAFLAALAVAGAAACAGLAGHWQAGVERTVMILVAPAERERALARLATIPGLGTARVLDPAVLARVLHPWLGDASTLPVVVLEAPITGAAPSAPALTTLLQAAAPSATIERDDILAGRLSQVALALQAVAALVLGLVSAVAMGVTVVATRGSLATLRPSIEIAHGLGATDGFIAGRFARRALRRAGLGGALGTMLAVPVIGGLAMAAEPLAPAGLPAIAWAALPAIPLLCAALGWAMAHRTVRRWLRDLP